MRRLPRCSVHSVSFYVRDDALRKREGLLATLGDSYQPGAGIGGVGNALHIAGSFQLIDQEACGLLGDGCLLG